MPETVIKDSETTYGMGENICKQCSQQRLISKMCKYLIQLNTKKKQTIFKKWAEDINRHVFKEDIIDGQQAHEKMLNITKY